MSVTCPQCGSAIAPARNGGGGAVCCPACHEPLNRVPGPDGLCTTADDPQGTGPDPGQTTPGAPADHRQGKPGGGPPPGYVVLGELGRGGMGIVYRARQVQLGRTVALKMILAGGHADEAELARFRTEAEAVARLNHPGIVQMYEVGEWEGQPYFALEFCPQGTLAAKLAGTPLPARAAAVLLQRLAEAVAAAHGAGVVHRDLKPANVLLAADGMPKVADFGLALRLDIDDRQTRTGAVMGTPSYMAPEQALGQTRRIGPAVDVYALGAVLYELLTGRPPFKGATVLETLDQVRRQEVVPPRRLNPQVPRDLETICLLCLRKEPEKRYPGAAALADDLARFLEGRPVVARPLGRLERTLKRVQRNPVVSALAALTVASVLAGLTAFAWQFRKAVRNEDLAVKKAEEATTAEGQALRDKAEATKQTRLAEERAEKLRVALKDRERALSASERSRANGSLARAEQAWKAGNYRIARELHDDVPKPLRGWAWNYLEREFQGGLFTAYGNTGPVAALAFSPDGSLLAAVDQAETTVEVDHVCVWDASTGVALPAFRGGIAGRGFVVFTPDGRSLLTRQPHAAGWAVRRWEVASGTPAPGPTGWAASTSWFPAVSPDGKRLAGVDQTGEVRIYGLDGPPVTCAGGHADGIRVRPAFSSDGSLLALAVTGGVRVWNAASGQLLQTLATGKGPLAAVVFSPDGRSLAAGGPQPGGVRLWDTRTWQARPALAAANAFALAFSPDGEWLAVAQGTGLIQVLDVRTGAEIGKLRGPPQGGAGALAFSPDGQRLAVGAADHTVRVWDLRPLAPPPPGDPKARPVAATPDGEFTRAAVLTADDRLRVLDTASGAELLRIRGVRDRAESIALSPDGRRLAFSPRQGPFGRDVVLVRSVPDNRPLRTVWLPAYADKVAFSPEGAELSVISPTDGPRRGIQRAELASDRQTVWEDSGNRWGVASLAYSPDGLSFVAGFGDGKIRVWDRKTGRLKGTLSGHSDRVNCLAFSPDSRRLVSGGRADRAVILWDFPARRQLLRRSGHESGVAQVALSPDGQLIASLGADGNVNLWDAVNGQQVLTLGGLRDGSLKIGFSRDGGRLLRMTNTGAVVQWQGAPAPFRRTLRGHDNKIGRVVFSPDGRLLASFAIQLKWWDVASGRDLFDGEHLGQFATSLVFRPDGRQLGLTTIQNTVQVWDVAERKKRAHFDAKVMLWRIALSPKEGVLATWDDKRGLAVWEFPAVRQRFRVSVAAAGLPEVAFSADGRLVTVTDALGRRTAFDAATGQPATVPPDFRPAVPPASPVSPDGSLFALPEFDQLHLVALRPEPAERERRRTATRTDPGWQDRQAARHEAARNWFAAVVHLNALLRERPADDTLKARRAKAVAALAELDKK